MPGLPGLPGSSRAAAGQQPGSSRARQLGKAARHGSWERQRPGPPVEWPARPLVRSLAGQLAIPADWAARPPDHQTARPTARLAGRQAASQAASQPDGRQGLKPASQARQLRLQPSHQEGRAGEATGAGPAFGDTAQASSHCLRPVCRPVCACMRQYARALFCGRQLVYKCASMPRKSATRRPLTQVYASHISLLPKG